jgi:hypothetical protein
VLVQNVQAVQFVQNVWNVYNYWNCWNEWILNVQAPLAATGEACSSDVVS